MSGAIAELYTFTEFQISQLNSGNGFLEIIVRHYGSDLKKLAFDLGSAVGSATRVWDPSKRMTG